MTRIPLGPVPPVIAVGLVCVPYLVWGGTAVLLWRRRRTPEPYWPGSWEFWVWGALFFGLTVAVGSSVPPRTAFIALGAVAVPTALAVYLLAALWVLRRRGRGAGR